MREICEVHLPICGLRMSHYLKAGIIFFMPESALLFFQSQSEVAVLLGFPSISHSLPMSGLRIMEAFIDEHTRPPKY